MAYSGVPWRITDDLLVVQQSSLSYSKVTSLFVQRSRTVEFLGPQGFRLYNKHQQPTQRRSGILPYSGVHWLRWSPADELSKCTISSVVVCTAFCCTEQDFPQGPRRHSTCCLTFSFITKSGRGSLIALMGKLCAGPGREVFSISRQTDNVVCRLPGSSNHRAAPAGCAVIGRDRQGSSPSGRSLRDGDSILRCHHCPYPNKAQ